MLTHALKPLMALFTGCLACAPFCTPMARLAEVRMERARGIPHVQCDDVTAAARAEQVLGMRGILGVEPLTVTRHRSKGRDESRLVGLEIRYAAPPGVTTAWLQRQLECHQAEVILGRAPAREDDPFVSPEEWLELAVGDGGSVLVVQIAAQSQETATASAERARRLHRRAQAW
jgi:hypothetical protein